MKNGFSVKKTFSDDKVHSSIEENTRYCEDPQLRMHIRWQ